ncbi:hypothetical protein ACI5KX_07815 [Erythrobacter sp. GH1-10]|uniref:hypothetical protein n=1 Tax=Erythrobacter sp. GH1-10 TaxID=3349334 RepID=UPI00387828F5
MTDEFLAESGIGSPPPETQTRLVNAAAVCLDANNIADEKAEAFILANLGYMLAEEMLGRINGIGFDMGPAEELLARLQAEPDLDVAAYIDARPGQFDIPTREAAEANGMTHDHLLAWVGGYIGMRFQQQNGLRQLQAP